MAPGMGIREYSRHRGVTPAAVRKALKAGRITAVDGKIDPEIADSQWRSNTDETKPRNSVSGNPGGAARMPASSPAKTFARTPGLPQTGSYAAARAARETFEARLRELDLKVRTGKLIPVEQVRVAAFNMNRRARDLLLAIPDRVAAVIAGMADPAEVHRVLTEELRRVCEELSQPTTFDGHGEPVLD